MKLNEVAKLKIEGIFDLKEMFNYKANDLAWRKNGNFSDRGTFKIDNVEYEVRIDFASYENHYFMEVGFTADLGEGHSFQRTNNNQASKVLAVVKAAAEEKLEEYNAEYQIDGILFGAIFSNDKTLDDALNRYKTYERIAGFIAKKYGYGIKENIPLPNNAGKYVLLTKGKIPAHIIKRIEELTSSKN